MEISIFPNPTSENLVIRFNERLDERLKLSILDIYGRAIYFAFINAGVKEKEIMLPFLPAGVYFVELRNGFTSRAFKFVVGYP